MLRLTPSSASAPCRILGDLLKAIKKRGSVSLPHGRDHAFNKASIDVGPGTVPELDMQGPFDCAAARCDLGYVSKWPLERGLTQYAQWLASNDA